MLQVIKKLLLQIVDDIDAGNSNADEKELMQIVSALRKYTRKDKSINKYQAYTYLNISRAKFDNMVRAGLIPRGRKEPGSRELKWYKKDLPKPASK